MQVYLNSGEKRFYQCLLEMKREQSAKVAAKAIEDRKYKEAFIEEENTRYLTFGINYCLKNFIKKGKMISDYKSEEVFLTKKISEKTK